MYCLHTHTHTHTHTLTHTHTHTRTHTHHHTHTHSLTHRHLMAALVLGQLLSLLLCGTGVTSQLLEDRHSIAVPTSQAFINYALLAAVFGTTLATSENFIKTLKYNWWKYAILGMIDVEANFIIILAYKYTNLTSVQVGLMQEGGGALHGI